MLAFVYDTETSGLPKSWSADPLSRPDDWPHVVQLAWALVNTETDRAVSQWSGILQLPAGVEIDPGSEAIHGIGTLEIQAHGVNAARARETFTAALSRADIAVCHNVEFDRRVMLATAVREGDEALRSALGKVHLCTMLAGVDICRIPGPRGLKWPRLIELHEHLLGVDFEGAHDAMADVMACARCFLRLLEGVDGDVSRLNGTSVFES